MLCIYNTMLSYCRFIPHYLLQKCYGGCGQILAYASITCITTVTEVYGTALWYMPNKFLQLYNLVIASYPKSLHNKYPLVALSLVGNQRHGWPYQAVCMLLGMCPRCRLRKPWFALHNNLPLPSSIQDGYE